MFALAQCEWFLWHVSMAQNTEHWHLIATTRFLPHYTLVLNHVLYTIYTGRTKAKRKWNSNHRVSAQLFRELMLILFFNITKISHYISTCIAFGFAFARVLCEQACDPLFITQNIHRQCRRILNYARLSAHLSYFRGQQKKCRSM